MNEHYERLSNPPVDALKTINFGALKGKTDINPQWRYEALTEEFGLCGVGWSFEIVKTFTEAIPETSEMMVFAQINLYIKDKDGDDWSAPIPGFGGDYLIVKDKNGIHGNDEGYKMAVTDAIGTAAKMIGVASNVYRGRMDSKYSARQAPSPSKTKAPEPHKEDIKKDALRQVAADAKRLNLSAGDMKTIMKRHYGKDTSAELTDAEAVDLVANIEQYAAVIKNDDEKLLDSIK